MGAITRRKVTSEEIAKIQARSKEGCTRAELVQEFDRTYGTINRVLKTKVKPGGKVVSLKLVNDALQAVSKDPVEAAIRHLIQLLLEKSVLTGDTVEDVYISVPNHSYKMFFRKMVEGVV